MFFRFSVVYLRIKHCRELEFYLYHILDKVNSFLIELFLVRFLYKNEKKKKKFFFINKFMLKTILFNVLPLLEQAQNKITNEKQMTKKIIKDFCDIFLELNKFIK